MDLLKARERKNRLSNYMLSFINSVYIQHDISDFNIFIENRIKTKIMRF